MEIDSPTPEEAPAVVELWLSLVLDQQRHGAHLVGEANRGPASEMLRQAIADRRVLIARAETPVGFVSFRIEAGAYEQDVTRGLIENVYVVPDRRAEGIGTALLDRAEQALTDRGASVIALEALAANDRVRSLYRKLGYEPHRVEFERQVKE
ncbi:MAG: acetyltransferase [halophilic archaeon J07HX5]|jgi:Acetyltransferases|nr:MAG: acetyltransferase [halophilic archaeon J07HX5]